MMQIAAGLASAFLAASLPLLLGAVTGGARAEGTPPVVLRVYSDYV